MRYAANSVSFGGVHVNSSVEAELTKSFSSAADTASRYPTSVQDNIITAAKTAFLQGDQWAYLAGIVAVVLGATLVFFMFPKKEEEERLLASYQALDTAAASETTEAAPAAAPAPRPSA